MTDGTQDKPVMVKKRHEMADSGMENEKLTTAQQRAITALLTTKSIVEAAKTAKIAERTLRRWLAEDEAFRQALTMAEGELITLATRRLLGLQSKALGVLEAVLDDADMSASIKLRAAMAVFDYTLKLREWNNIEQRLAALEASIAK